MKCRQSSQGKLHPLASSFIFFDRVGAHHNERPTILKCDKSTNQYRVSELQSSESTALFVRRKDTVDFREICRARPDASSDFEATQS